MNMVEAVGCLFPTGLFLYIYSKSIKIEKKSANGALLNQGYNTKYTAEALEAFRMENLQ